MFGARNINVQSNQTTSDRPLEQESLLGTIYDVILDVDHPILDSLEIPTESRAFYIGAIQFRPSNDLQRPDEELPLAIPLNQTYTSVPIKNEIVKISVSSGGSYFYERLIKSSNPNVSNETTTINSASKPYEPKDNQAGSYSKVQQTGITRSTADSSADYDGYGEYFQPNENLHYLKLYEGDSIIQSRFGQSIRFSGYNNGDNEFSPNIIIRSGENPETISNSDITSIEEDINKDGNIIFLGGGNRLLDYTLPTENEYPSFYNYPSELRGNQILLNSDRVILSAKAAEMIFAAKKDVGFITDGQFSIDATNGINITTDNHIFVDTQNRDINLNIGNGTVALGTDGELEAAPKGETLVELLGELIDLIAQQIYLTPSGPTSPGPTNIAQFTTLKSKLNTLLSNHVQLK
jgi:hypothetical protein